MRTVSPPASACTACAMAASAAASTPGQVSGLCGQEIQVAWCGAHSAGMRKPSSAGAGRVIAVMSGPLLRGDNSSRKGDSPHFKWGLSPFLRPRAGGKRNRLRPYLVVTASAGRRRPPLEQKTKGGEQQ
jgi:hypothetical protein